MIRTLKHLAYTLKFELSEIDAIINRIDYYYGEIIEIKANKDGSPKQRNGQIQKRIINPSKKRLKVLQSRILKNILSNIEIPNYAYGAVKGRNNILNAKKHQGKKFFFTTDLSSFFPSVSNRKVYEMFVSHGFSQTVSRYLTKLTTYKGRLPQGAPTSPYVANLVFIKTGSNLQAIANEYKLTFTSFIDDLTFSSPFDFKDKTQLILDAITKDGYVISHKKTNYKTKFPVVTGLVVKNNKLDLPTHLLEKLRNREKLTNEQVIGLERYISRVRKSN